MDLIFKNEPAFQQRQCQALAIAAQLAVIRSIALPAVSIAAFVGWPLCAYLMFSLPLDTWIRLVVWLGGLHRTEQTLQAAAPLSLYNPAVLARVPATR